MITLKNNDLTVTVSELGAELKSVLCDGTEYLWNGDSAFWSGTAPRLFPICGTLKEDRYTYEGKEYHLKKHGFARNTLFEVESAEPTRAVFLHTSDEKTKQCYPFDYELRVRFALHGRAIEVGYEIKNKSNGAMYFNVGSHEAYATPEGIEEYDVIFPQGETLDTCGLCGPLLNDERFPILKESRYLPLYERYFDMDTLIFKDIASRSATLRNRKNGRAVRVDFPDADHLLIWHKQGAPFICLEPWNGLPDVVGSSFELCEKLGIKEIERDGVYRATHTVTLL
ncbi:MAG: aldose 1-epimerase family protein [Clostridia bacterium]|nr:aldose 1-epimerase family protein [Clostridia bacterium]